VLHGHSRWFVLLNDPSGTSSVRTPFRTSSWTLFGRAGKPPARSPDLLVSEEEQAGTSRCRSSHREVREGTLTLSAKSSACQEPEVQIARPRYLLSHGCKENWGERLREWPGVHCVEALTEGQVLEGWWSDRTRSTSPAAAASLGHSFRGGPLFGWHLVCTASGRAAQEGLTFSTSSCSSRASRIPSVSFYRRRYPCLEPWRCRSLPR
jgi:hypothetical protein